MVLTNREKYICHKTIITFLTMAGRMKKIEITPDLAEILLRKVSNARCRILTIKDIRDIDNDLTEEFLLGVGLYKELSNI